MLKSELEKVILYWPPPLLNIFFVDIQVTGTSSCEYTLGLAFAKTVLACSNFELKYFLSSAFLGRSLSDNKITSGLYISPNKVCAFIIFELKDTTGPDNSISKGLFI